MSTKEVPQRGDGFDSRPQSTGDTAGAEPVVNGFTLSAIRGMSIPQIMDSFAVDERKAQLIKDGVAGGAAGILAALAVHYLGDVVGEEWAGAFGGMIGGFVGGMGSKKLSRKRRRY